MKKINIIFFIFFCQICFSQVVDNASTINKINEESKKYLIKKGELNVDNLNEQYFIFEIVEKKAIGYNRKGIYRLYTNKTPSFTYIILKDGDSFQILDLRDFSKEFKKISKFLSSGFENNIIVNYMEEILKVYNYNRYDEKIKL
jgi:hypothetical protein